METTTKPYEKEVTYETRFSNLKNELTRASITMPDRQIRTKNQRKNQKKNGTKTSKQERHKNRSAERTTPNPSSAGKFHDFIGKKKNTLESVDREFESGIPNFREEDQDQK